MGKALRTIVSIFGGLFISFGIALIFFSIFLSSLRSNIDNLDEIAQSAFDQFILENKPEIVNFILQQSNGQNGITELNKETILAGCQSGFFSTYMCSNVGSLPENELIENFEDYLVEEQFVKPFNQGYLNEMTAGMKQEWNKAKPIFNLFSLGLVGGIILFLIGSFFIIISSKFKWYNSFYKISFKSAVNFLTILIFIVVLKSLSSNVISSWILNSKTVLQSMPDLPDLFLNLVVSVIVEWFKLSLISVMSVAIGGLVIFIIAMIFFMGKRTDIKKNKKSKF